MIFVVLFMYCRQGRSSPIGPLKTATGGRLKLIYNLNLINSGAWLQSARQNLQSGLHENLRETIKITIPSWCFN